MKIKILQEAQNDIARAILFYDLQKVGLGEYFLDSIMSYIESLYLYFGIHFKVKNYFRLLSKRFLFAIKHDMTCIYIYAVLDCRQNPLFIDSRLK